MMTSAVDVARRRPALVAALRVECVNDHWGFTALRPHWNELLRASTANGPFLTWEWLHAWWRHLSAGGQLRIIVVRAGQELVAVAPLTVSDGHFGLFQRLDFLGNGHAGSDYLDFIVRAGREQEAVAAIARFIRHEGLALRLDHLPPSSMAALVAEQLEADGWTVGH